MSKKNAASRKKVREALTKDNIKRFFQYLVQCPSVGDACKAAGVSRSLILRRRSIDPEFEKKYQKYYQMGVEAAQDELVRRAMEGDETTIFDPEGEVKSRIHKKDTSALKFYLQHNHPNYKRESVSSEQSVNVNVTVPGRTGLYQNLTKKHTDDN